MDAFIVPNEAITTMHFNATIICQFKCLIDRSDHSRGNQGSKFLMKKSEKNEIALQMS